MAWYPFDTQSCSMVFVVPKTFKSFIKLKLSDLHYVGPTELTQYFVRKTFMEGFQEKDKEGLRIMVILGRRLLSNFLTIYLPTILLNVTGHATVYFKPFFFEAIITVNLTVMLVGCFVAICRKMKYKIRVQLNSPYYA